MVAEAPNGTPPLFYYYDIVAYFYIADSLNNGFFFWKYFLAWFGFEPKIHAIGMLINSVFSPFLDDTFPICCVSNPYRRDLMNTIFCTN